MITFKGGCYAGYPSHPFNEKKKKKPELWAYVYVCEGVARIADKGISVLSTTLNTTSSNFLKVSIVADWSYGWFWKSLTCFYFITGCLEQFAHTSSNFGLLKNNEPYKPLVTPRFEKFGL